MGIKARGRGKKALFGRRGGKWQDFAGLAEDFMWSKRCVIWGGGHSERKRGDRLQFPDYETHSVTQLKTQKKHEYSCRLWDTHSREHTLSHSWRHTESHNWRHRKKTWTQLQILRHTQQGTHSVTQSKVYCVTQLKSHRHTMLQKPRNRDIALQTLRNTKLTPPPPSTLEWQPHNSPCAHPQPHLELHFSGNVRFPIFTPVPLF